MNGYSRVAFECCILILLLCVGCKEAAPPVVPAQGVVLLNGIPLPKAQVQFIPQIRLGAEYIATGVTDDRGRFTLQCNGQQGACATENAVIVSEGEIPKELQSENAQRELAVYRRSLKNRPIPQGYSSLVSTPFQIFVTEGQTEYKLELER